MPLADVAERELNAAAGRFFHDVLSDRRDGPAKLWRSKPDRKDYGPGSDPRNGKRRIAPSDVSAHLRGEWTCVAGPIRNCIVIDADLTGTPSGHEAPEETKQLVLDGVALLLDSLDVPAVSFDSARGTHTWIRLLRAATPAELEAFRRLLADLSQKQKLPVTFEVFPQGDHGLRLPGGVYLSKPRHAIPELSAEELLAWLTKPERATEEQLAAIVAAAPAPVSSGRVTGTKPARNANEEADRAETPEPDEGEPIRGWNRWPECKRAFALSGPKPGERHKALLSLACEAVESGERDGPRLFNFLADLPRPHSKTPQAEHERDVLAAIEGAVKLKEANDPRRFSSCPHVPNHSGEPTSNQHRSTFEHECSSERGETCPIRLRWQREENLPAYAHIISSSIWREGRGHGAGFGPAGKAVYKFLLRKSLGDPEHTFEASERYLWANLINDARPPAIRSILARLEEEGLIKCVEKGKPNPRGDTPSRYRVPFRPPGWVKALEVRLGTAQHERNARRELHNAWSKVEPFQA